MPKLTLEEREALDRAQAIIETRMHRIACDVRFRPQATKTDRVGIMLALVVKPVGAGTLADALEKVINDEE